MVLAVLADRLVFDIIPTLYFSHGKEKSIVGQAILILNIMFNIIKPT